MKKTAMALAVMMGMTAAIPNISMATAGTGGFKDTDKHWSKSYVERLYKEGYVKGSNGYFKPDSTLKTEDFLIMALKVVKPEFKDLTAGEGQKYYTPYLEKAAEIGLIKDAVYDEVPRHEGRDMPRELAVQVVDRALVLMGETVAANHDLEYKFKDYKIINDINRDAVLKAYQLGIIKGSNGNFEPKNPLTRAEAAVLITKLMDKSMRDKLTISKNTKDYGEIINWFITKYQEQVDKRTVVIEKKADGTLNRGDIDYTEKAFMKDGKWINWWSDQAFEDATTGLSNTQMERNNNAIGIGAADINDEQEMKLTRTGGSYLPYDGELMFINFGNRNDGKAQKHYDMHVPNFNRIAYDLAKYSTQGTMEQGKYFRFLENDSNYAFIIQGSSYVNNVECWLSMYKYPSDEQKSYKTKFAPKIGLSVVDGDYFVENEFIIKQWLVRLYGEKDGLKVFNLYKDYAKGKDEPTKSKSKTVTVNGIQLYFSDEEFVAPSLTATLR